MLHQQRPQDFKFRRKRSQDLNASLSCRRAQLRNSVMHFRALFCARGSAALLCTKILRFSIGYFRPCLCGCRFCSVFVKQCCDSGASCLFLNVKVNIIHMLTYSGFPRAAEGYVRFCTLCYIASLFYFFSRLRALVSGFAGCSPLLRCSVRIMPRFTSSYA